MNEEEAGDAYRNRDGKAALVLLWERRDYEYEGIEFAHPRNA